MGLQKFSIEEVHHEHPRTADTQHDAQLQRTEGSIRGNGGCNRLFVEGLPWIARMGKPKRANYFKAGDHDSYGTARRRAYFVIGDGPSYRPPLGIIETLNKEINAGLADPKLKARIADLGGVPMPVAPAGFGRFIAEETEKWGKVIKFAGIKVK